MEPEAGTDTTDTLEEINTEPTQSSGPEPQSENGPDLQPLILMAGALLDTDRIRIVAALVSGPANRMQLHESLGIGHRELLRHLDNLQQAGIVKLGDPTQRNPDHYSPYELNLKAFSEARRALGKYHGVRPRPTDARELVLDTFMPGGKLVAFPKKQDQIITILDVLAQKFEPEKQYSEHEVNVILEEANEDYCTLRRYLVDFGYLNRSSGVYEKRES